LNMLRRLKKQLNRIVSSRQARGKKGTKLNVTFEDGTRFLCCRGSKLELGPKTLLMGILNLTPDSFADGGRYISTEKALEQAARLIREGADILDIGGESTRPGYAGISAEEEWARLEPVLKELLPRCPVPVSVDTQKAAVAEKALNYGVHIINDIWGLQRDPAMAGVISASQAAVVIMHNRNNTEYTDLLGEILAFLEQSIELALKSGIREDRIVIDPGIGFGKTPEQNLEVLSRLAEFKALPYPLLLGVSRKSVIGRTLHLPVEERLEPTIALNTLGIAAGADIIRVHDLAANKKAAMMTDLVIRRKREKTEGAEANIIHLKGMEFYAYHGVLPEEQELGQRFVVDVDLYPEKWVKDKDCLENTINYAAVYEVIKTCVEKERYKLLESLAEEIAARILAGFACELIRVEIHKPNAPLPGVFRDVSVEIFRGRAE
jgi:dihydropteroate synthase/dihydroneopterin aldolase